MTPAWNPVSGCESGRNICLYIYFLLCTCMLYTKHYIGTANGDISFGSSTIRPTFQFIGTLPPRIPFRFITFDVNTDNILEGQEIGLLTIAPSTVFDGFAPRFQSVRIIIEDSNSECTMDCNILSCMWWWWQYIIVVAIQSFYQNLLLNKLAWFYEFHSLILLTWLSGFDSAWYFADILHKGL